MSTFIKVIAITLPSSILLVAIGHVFLEHSSVGGLLQVAKRHSIWFTLWRYLIYALIIAIWPYLIATIGKTRRWPSEIIDYFKHQRLKVFGFLILIEFLLIDNLLGHLITWL